MGGPPAVTVAIPGVGLDGHIAAGLTFLLVLTLVGLFGFGAVQIPADLIYLVPMLLFSLALAVFCMSRSRPAVHGSVLRWDGQNWFWSRQNDDGLCAVHCVMDFQAWMLLRLQTSEDARECIWLQRKDHVKSWYPLRRALIFDKVSADSPAVEIGGKQL
jgi:hypothetical protein